MGPSYFKSHLGKIYYPNQREAQQVIDKMAPNTMNAYYCGWCPGWHIGHAEGTRSYADKGQAILFIGDDKVEDLLK